MISLYLICTSEVQGTKFVPHMAVKVTLRKKTISKGRKSLYLDYYPEIPHPVTGEPTRREFLGLYIVDKPKTPIDKLSNSETMKIAETKRASI